MNCSADENNATPNREVDLNNNNNENNNKADMNNNIPTKDSNNNGPAKQKVMLDDDNNAEKNEPFHNDIIYEDIHENTVSLPTIKTRSPLVSSVFEVKAKKNKEVAELFDNSLKYDVVYPDNLTFR